MDTLNGKDSTLGPWNVFITNNGSADQFIKFFNIPQTLYSNLPSASHRENTVDM